MCGIAGFIQRAPAPEVLDAMLAALAHRGPDGEGRFFVEHDGWHVALGHRRLSIIDLEGGGQPMGNEDGRVQITYNGELYNFRTLRASLEAKGHRFATRSDTEVIVHHYEQAGERGFSDLNGMFAFGVWDGRSGSLVLARDRIGIKPLYWTVLPDGGIAFASELAALLRHPGVRRRVSREGLASYLFSDYAHPPWTLVDGVRKLEPAHAMTWRAGTTSPPRPFFRLGDVRPRSIDGVSDCELARELWHRLERAVKAQMVSDVPIGVFLSGGLDSSSVAAIACRASSDRLLTFSVGFEDAGFDESPFARLVARRIGSRHVEEIYGERDLLGTLDEALATLDEPLADHSYLPTYMLSRFAARHVKVALGGDGGDELFGGYPTYLAHAYGSAYGLLPGALRRALASAATSRLPVSAGYQGLDWKIRRFAGRWDDDPLRRHLRWLSSVDLPDLGRIAPACAGSVPATLGATYARFDEPLTQLMAVDITSYLPGSILTKVDRAAMAHGLEVRPPLLDNDLVDWAFSLPDRVKIRRGHNKHLLKLAAAPHVPRAVVHRKKRGFAVPLVAWLRGPLLSRIDGVLARSVLWDAGLLDRSAVRRYRDEHAAKRADHSKPLWAVLVLAGWLERHGVRE